MTKKPDKSCIIPPKFQKPNRFLYFVLFVATLWARRHYRIRYKKEALKAVRKIKGPVLVIGTHHGPYDFAVMISAMYPKRMSIVVAANLYYSKIYAKAVRMLKTCIPKKQFTSDLGSVKNIKKMIDAGISVALYPEGRFSIDGKNGRYADSVNRLIKWLGVPVVFIKCNASYHIRPRYAEDHRIGRLDAEVKTLFTAEEVKNLTVEEISARLKEEMSFNDMEYQAENGIAFKGKLGTATGLPNLLYKCPKCGAEFKHKTEGNAIFCTVCGNRAVLDEYGKITPDEGSVAPERIDFWYDWQYRELQKEIRLNADYELSHKVVLAAGDDKICDLIRVDEGVLTLNKDGFFYDGKEYKGLRFPIPNPPSLALYLPSHIDMFDGDVLYRFIFEGGERPVKMNAAVEILFDEYLSGKKGKND